MIRGKLLKIEKKKQFHYLGKRTIRSFYWILKIYLEKSYEKNVHIKQSTNDDTDDDDNNDFNFQRHPLYIHADCL